MEQRGGASQEEAGGGKGLTQEKAKTIYELLKFMLCFYGSRVFVLQT